MLRMFLAQFLAVTALFAVDDDWLLKAQQVNEETVNWLKNHLKEKLASETLLKNHLSGESDILQKHCRRCGSEDLITGADTSLYVFMSFSLEDSLWVQYSKEMEKIGGVFVLRGLPGNSFKELADRIFDLQEKGVSIPIQIHPKLFQECDVQLVPAIVVIEGSGFDKVAGNLSLKCALEKMSQAGETPHAKLLYKEYISGGRL